MNLKVGDILVTQNGTNLYYAVIAKENKTTYTVTFLNNGSTDTVNKTSLTSYGGYYYGNPHYKYLPYEGKLEPDAVSLLKEKETLSSELEACKEELFAAKCILNRMLAAPEAYTDVEYKVLEDVKQNPTEFYSDAELDSNDDYWDDDDDWDYGDDPEDDDEPCEEPYNTDEASIAWQEVLDKPCPVEDATYGDSLEAQETDIWIMPK